MELFFGIDSGCWDDTNFRKKIRRVKKEGNVHTTGSKHPRPREVLFLESRTLNEKRNIQYFLV